MENVADTQYSEKYARTEQVQLASELEPFLRPSCYVNYAAGDDCVALAGQLAAGAADEAGMVSAVYAYIVDHIAYDTPKAETIGTGYLSDADETLATGKASASTTRCWPRPCSAARACPPRSSPVMWPPTTSIMPGT